MRIRGEIASAVAAVALLACGVVPARAQEVYNTNSTMYIREAIAALSKEDPDNHQALWWIHAAIEELRAAIVVTGELDAEQGTPRMDKLTAIAGQIAADDLDRAARTLSSREIARRKQTLIIGDWLRKGGRYSQAVEGYSAALGTADGDRGRRSGGNRAGQGSTSRGRRLGWSIRGRR